MIGTYLNVAGILIGGTAGLIRRKPVPPASEAYFKVVLGAFTVFYGLRLTWVSLSGPILNMLKELLIVIVALSIGKFLGHLLRLQNKSNRIGRRAREAITTTRADDPDRAGKGFRTCAALFCVAPLGILGAVQDGLSSPGYFYPLAIKAVIDGLAAMGFVSLFGSGVLLSAIPVLTVQGSITLVTSRVLTPSLELHDLINPINAVGGLLVFSVALVMLGLKRIELADYLPSLVIAPLLAWCFH
jgi:uncharacterized membrane protein YqgA involved in biofilm formation